MTVAARPPIVPTRGDARPRVRRAILPRAARVIDLGWLLTAEQFGRFPAGDAAKRELVDGRIVEMPPVGIGHSERQLGFGSLLRAWNDREQLGRVGVEIGFILDRDPDVVRGPDVAFIRHGKIPADHDDDDFVEAAPDFVVEVKSKNDAWPELRSKAAEYLAFGVAMVALLDRKSRTLEVHRPDAEPLVLGEGDAFDGGDVLPGFSARVADLV